MLDEDKIYDEKWKKQLPKLSNKELAEECENLNGWTDCYYGDLTEVLVKEIKERLNKK